MKKLILVLLLFPCLLRGQGAQFSTIVLNSRGNPAAGATITVCTSSATLISTIVDLSPGCTPQATIYTSPSLSIQQTNPFQADGFGNVTFYTPPGTYTYSIGGSSVT